MSFLINPLLSIVAGVATTYYLNNKSPPLPPTSPSAASVQDIKKTHPSIIQGLHHLRKFLCCIYL